MNHFREDDDLMTAEDWKAMYLLLFRAQTEVLERFDDLTPNGVRNCLTAAMQAAEERYINCAGRETLLSGEE